MVRPMPEHHTLFVAPSSAPCRAVLLHHRLLGAGAPELEIVEIDLADRDRVAATVGPHNPLQCVPTLVTPWGPIWESRACMRYLEAIIPEPVFYPLDVFRRAVVDRLLDWDLGTLYRAVSSVVYPQIFGDAQEPTAEDLERLDKATRFLDVQQLGDDRAFLTGPNLTIADICCAMTLSLLRLIGLELDDVPNMTAWQARVASLEAFAEIDAPFQTWVESVQQPEPEPAAAQG